MTDVITLAKDAVSFLAPFLPYLLKAGANFTEEAGKKLGEQLGGGVWEKVKGLWAKLQPKVEAKPATKEAVQEVAAQPDDEDAKAALRMQLKKLFTEDQTLADEVLKIFEEARRGGINVAAIGDRSFAAGGDVTSSTVITGDVNKT
jgi:hypothetical protein